MAKKEGKKKRRKLLDSEDRKALTLDALFDVFARYGFAGATTASLAKASGVSQALLYKLFPSKKAMYREMARAKLAKIAGTLDGIPPTPPKDDMAFFTEMARVLVATTKDDPSFTRLLFFSVLQDDAFAAEFRRAKGECGFLPIETYIKQRISDGEFRQVHAGLAAWAFVSMVMQYAQDVYVFKPRRSPPVEDEVAIASFVDLFLRGIRA